MEVLLLFSLFLEAPLQNPIHFNSRKVLHVEIINYIYCIGGSVNEEDTYPIIIDSHYDMAVYL